MIFYSLNFLKSRPKKAKVNESRLPKQQSLPKSGGKKLLFGDDDDDGDDDFPDL